MVFRKLIFESAVNRYCEKKDTRSSEEGILGINISPGDVGELRSNDVTGVAANADTNNGVQSPEKWLDRLRLLPPELVGQTFLGDQGCSLLNFIFIH
jgi:hypothetical protein